MAPCREKKQFGCTPVKNLLFKQINRSEIGGTPIVFKSPMGAPTSTQLRTTDEDYNEGRMYYLFR